MTTPLKFENTKPVISNDDLLDDLKRVSALVAQGRVLTKLAYKREGKFAVVTFQKRFGNWRAAVTAAGFEVGSEQNISDEQLIDNLRDCWMKLGRQPRRLEMRSPASKFTHHPYVRRFGSWLNAMKTFCEVVDTMGPDTAPILEPSAPKGPRGASLRLRFLVMRRDQFRCVLCGRSPATDSNVVLHVDHIFAWSKGGATELKNLRTLCFHCNIGKSDLHPTDMP